MKSRTSYFNPTAFKKNLTRFAPVWGLYTVCLFLGLFVMADSGVSYWLFANMANCIQFMPIVNLGYALICAQLLFGDLYNARMCNMLHALPIRREGWFVTHAASALAFSFVPTLLMALAAMAVLPFTEMVNAWQIPLYWLLGTNLEFLFFFGVASLAALCVGSRFAQAAVYVIVNFISVLVWFLVDTLYTPLLYGIQTNEKPFLWFCPVVEMTELDYINCKQIEVYRGLNEYGHSMYDYYGEFTVTGNWWYLLLCAAIGVAFLAIALWLYRNRKLETAGDFIAIKALEPVFLVLYTVTVGTCLYFFFQNIMGYYNGIIFLFVGLAIGWFTGKMFLERRVNVFHKKTFLGLAVLVAVFLASIGLVYVDPFGIESWMPEAEDLVSVHVGTGHGTYHQSDITLTDKADIEKVLSIHASALQKRIDETSWETVEPIPVVREDGPIVIYETEPQYKEQVSIKLTYTLKNGTIRSRYYWIYAEDEEGQILNRWFSSPEAIFGVPREEITREWLRELAGKIDSYGGNLDATRNFLTDLTREDRVALLEAVLADCEAGTMTQHYAFNRFTHDLFWISWPQNDRRYGEIRVDMDDVHTVAWLEGRGLDIRKAFLEEYGEEYVKEYGID